MSIRTRPEYFFASGTAHVEKLAGAGVIALLFGAGAGGQIDSVSF